jgi:queuosine precursor transporter
MMTTLIIGIYIACELIANVTASKPVTFVGLVAPGGVFIYAITFTLVDLINERLGKRGARQVVYTAVAANLLLAVYSTLIVVLPSPAFFTQTEAFRTVLGSTPRIVAASLIAYLVSSLIDVEVFDMWKKRYAHYKWARVLVSNGVSTAIDSAVFVVIAFAGVLPVIPLIAGQYAIKMAVTVISIPLIYVTRALPSEEPGGGVE